MARVLITANRLPADAGDGRNLRLHHFCRQLAARHDCYVAVIGGDAEHPHAVADLGVRDCRSLNPVPGTGRSSRRLFRLSDARYIELSNPEYIEDARQRLSSLCREWNIDIIFCLTNETAEITLPLDRPKLLDFCDSASLTFERRLANRRNNLSPLERGKCFLALMRARQTEAAMIRSYDHTTTISCADRDALLRSSGATPDKISVVPNGVEQSALEAGEADVHRSRSVVFWGHLDFSPNRSAVEYFYEEIFLPHLAGEGVEWHIYGSGSDRLRSFAEHPLIRVHGFVESLYREVRRHEVMVNPMVEGSGLKNKILEAFACRVPVVSTLMGIEATGAISNFHFLPGNTPEEFARNVLRLFSDPGEADELRANARQYVEAHFAWEAIGEQLAERVLDLQEDKRLVVAQ